MQQCPMCFHSFRALPPLPWQALVQNFDACRVLWDLLREGHCWFCFKKAFDEIIVDDELAEMNGNREYLLRAYALAFRRVVLNRETAKLPLLTGNSKCLQRLLRPSLAKKPTREIVALLEQTGAAKDALDIIARAFWTYAQMHAVEIEEMD